MEIMGSVQTVKNKDNSMRKAFTKRNSSNLTLRTIKRKIWLSDHGLKLSQQITILPPKHQSSSLRRKNMTRNKQDGLPVMFQSAFAAKNYFKSRSYKPEFVQRRNWIWKVFEISTDNFFMCKLNTYQFSEVYCSGRWF